MFQSLDHLRRRVYEGVNYRLRSVAGGRWADHCRPTSIIFMLTERCNARCVHCDIWKNRGKEDPPSPELYRTVLTDLRRWLGPVSVTFSGGEALLKSYAPELVAHASSLGLYTELLTNGYLDEPSRIEELALARPSRVTVSLDGMGETHSKIRGREQFFAKTMSTIEALLRLRKEHNLPYVLRLKCVIMAHNLGDVPEVAKFAAQDGVHVFYQPIEQNYNSPEDPRWFEHSDNWPQDTARVLSVVRELIEMKRRGAHIDNSFAQLEAMVPYFSAPDSLRVRTKGHSAHERRPLCAALTMIEFRANGDVMVCSGRPPVGNIKTAAIRDIWENRPQWWRSGCCLNERFTPAEKQSTGVPDSSMTSLSPSKTVVSVFGVRPRRVGGGEVFIRELSSRLGELGWRSVLCFLEAPPEPVRRYLQLPSVAIEVLPDSSKLGWAPASRLGTILRRYRPEILHLHFTGFLSPYAWLARALGIPQVFFTDQASRPEGYSQRRAARWKRILTRAINWPLDTVTCASDYNLRCWVVSDLLPARRFLRIYNSVDVGRRPPEGSPFRQRFLIPAGRQLIVQVGQIRPEKGITDLLEAARIVVSKNPNVHFAFVGEGAGRPKYTDLAVSMGLQDHVTWTGLLQDAVAAGAYSDADIVCQVSRWEEAFGYAITEAMAAGRPLVGTRVGGIPEVIEDGRTGFLVPRGDPAAIADKLLCLLADPALRESMGRAGRAAVEAKFDVRKNVAEFLRLYRL